jgi:hypothetical protein
LSFQCLRPSASLRAAGKNIVYFSSIKSGGDCVSVVDQAYDDIVSKVPTSKENSLGQTLYSCLNYFAKGLPLGLSCSIQLKEKYPFCNVKIKALKEQIDEGTKEEFTKMVDILEEIIMKNTTQLTSDEKRQVVNAGERLLDEYKKTGNGGKGINKT